MVRKEKERRRSKNRKYGQAKLTHAKRGILSCIFAGIVFVVLASLLTAAYISEGSVAPVTGGIGLVCVILSGYGLYISLRGFKEREKNYLTCKIGMGCHLAFLVGLMMIFCRGLF